VGDGAEALGRAGGLLRGELGRRSEGFPVGSSIGGPNRSAGGSWGGLDRVAERSVLKSAAGVPWLQQRQVPA